MSDAGREAGPRTTAPPKISKPILYSAVVGVLAMVAVLLTVMAREPDDRTSAAAIVAEVLARLPQGTPLSAEDVAAAARGLAEAEDLVPGDLRTSAALARIQDRIAEELRVAVVEGRLDRAESVLLAARGAWPEAGRFAEGGPLARRLREAQEIRTLVAEVRDLIAQARDSLAVPGGGDSGRLESLKAVITELKGALDGLQGVQESAVAAEARDGIRRELADSAQSAIDARQPETAQQFLAAADGLGRGDPEIADLQRQATRLAESVSLSAQVAERLATARVRLVADRLLKPEGDSAVSHFEAVLELDSGNMEAARGLEEVAARYGVLAGQALDRRETERAGTLIRNLAELSPDHEGLAGLRARRDDILAADRERAAVARAETQTPAEAAASAGPAPAPRPETPAPVPIDEEGRVWAAAAGTCDAKLLRVYIDRYPSGRHVDQAWAELSACQG